MKTKIFLLLMSLIFISNAFGQTTQVVFDPTIKTSETKVSPAEEKLVKTVLPKTRKSWTEDSCAEDFSVTGKASGSFTKQNAAQTAYLYEFCQTRNGFANDGIVIVEAGKIVAHYLYEGAWALNLTSLPDINNNGIDELVVHNSGGMHQGIFGTGLDVLEITTKGVKEFGATQTSYNDCGAGLSKKCSDDNYKITVVKGATPVFYSQKFVETKKKWKAVGKSAKAKMFKLEYKYRLVR